MNLGRTETQRECILNQRLFPRAARSEPVPFPLPHPRFARRSALGSPRRRVASLPLQTAELGGGRLRARFLQTAPEGTTPAWCRRPSRNGVNEGNVIMSGYL